MTTPNHMDHTPSPVAKRIAALTDFERGYLIAAIADNAPQEDMLRVASALDERAWTLIADKCRSIQRDLGRRLKIRTRLAQITAGKEFYKCTPGVALTTNPDGSTSLTEIPKWPNSH